jgi:DNA repair ATPase RecN
MVRFKFTALDSYQEKIREIFEENEHIQQELDAYKKKFWDKESECFRLGEERESMIDELTQKHNELIENMKNDHESLKLEIELINKVKENLYHEIDELKHKLTDKGKSFL